MKFIHHIGIAIKSWYQTFLSSAICSSPWNIFPMLWIGFRCFIHWSKWSKCFESVFRVLAIESELHSFLFLHKFCIAVFVSPQVLCFRIFSRISCGLIFSQPVSERKCKTIKHYLCQQKISQHSQHILMRINLAIKSTVGVRGFCLTNQSRCHLQSAQNAYILSKDSVENFPPLSYFFCAQTLMPFISIHVRLVYGA